MTAITSPIRPPHCLVSDVIVVYLEFPLVVGEVEHVGHRLLHLQLLHPLTHGLVANRDSLRPKLELGAKIVLDVGILKKSSSWEVFSGVDILKGSSQRLAILVVRNFGPFEFFQLF